MANAEKVTAVAELTGRFKDSSGAVLTEYRGLTVAQLAELRRSLGDHATFAVVKNTLTRIAVTEAGLENQLSSLLSGPSAIAFVDVSATGTPLDLTDDGAAAITMPFAFSFYGASSSNLCIGNNGGILFNVASCSSFPSTSPVKG